MKLKRQKRYKINVSAFHFLLVDTKRLTINKKIAFMINRPLNVSPAQPPANPSPTFSQLHAKWRRKRWGKKE